MKIVKDIIGVNLIILLGCSSGQEHPRFSEEPSDDRAREELSSTTIQPEPSTTSPASPTSATWVELPVEFLFEKGSVSPTPDGGQKLVAALAEELGSRFGAKGDLEKLRITGYACFEDQAKSLARRRAKAVKSLLIDQGFPADSMCVDAVGDYCKICVQCHIGPAEAVLYQKVQLHIR